MVGADPNTAAIEIRPYCHQWRVQTDYDTWLVYVAWKDQN